MQESDETEPIFRVEQKKMDPQNVLQRKVMKLDICVLLLTNQLRMMKEFPVHVLNTVEQILTSGDD